MNRFLVVLFFFVLATTTAIILLLCGDHGVVTVPKRAAEPATVSAQTAPTHRVLNEPCGYPVQSNPTSFLQGVRGRLVDERWKPVSNAHVWLVPPTTSGLSAHAQDCVSESIIHVIADDRGDFAIGIGEELIDQARDLWVLAERHVDVTRPGLRLRKGEWRNLGSIKMQLGVTVEGIVTETYGTGRPIENADVSFIPKQAGPFSFVPGRENGLMVQTDSAGRYLISRIPAAAVKIGAVASGFARTEKEVSAMPATIARCDFQLSKGSEISGTITDTQGKGVCAARISARAEQLTRPIEVRSGRDGRFLLMGVLPGSYELQVSHDGFAPKSLASVAAPTTGVHVSLQRLASIHVQVNGAKGWMLSSYDVTVKRVASGSDAFESTSIPCMHIRTAPGEFGLITGLHPSVTPYVLQVGAPGHAHGFSEPFEVCLDQEPALIAVHLDVGAGMEGQVYGSDGEPLAGVLVMTLPCELGDGPLAAHRMSKMNTNITKTWAHTDSNGMLSIPLLAPGLYFLRLSHPQYSDITIRNIELRKREIKKLPAIQMQRGTMLSGQVHLSRVSPGTIIKVAVWSVLDGQSGQKIPIIGEAVVLPDGRFKISKRFPPGKYRVVVGRASDLEPYSRIDTDDTLTREIEIDGTKAELAIDLEPSRKQR